MKSLRVWLASIALGSAMIFSTPSAKAQVPDGFTYQGLLEQNSTPVNGSVMFNITLYDSSGNMFPSETFQDQLVENGVFNLVLGDFMPSPFQTTPSFNEPLFMMVDVVTTNGENTLQTALWSSPYAINCGTVKGISASFVPVSGDLFPVPIGTGYTGKVKLDPAFLPSISSGMLQMPMIQTINGIDPNSSGNFQIQAGNGITMTPGTNTMTISVSDVGSSSNSAVALTVQNAETSGNEALLVNGGIGANNAMRAADGSGLTAGSPQTFFADQVSVPSVTGTSLQVYNSLVSANSSIVLTPIELIAASNQLSITTQSSGTFTVSSTNTMGTSGGGTLTALNYMVVNH